MSLRDRLKANPDRRPRACRTFRGCLPDGRNRGWRNGITPARPTPAVRMEGFLPLLVNLFYGQYVVVHLLYDLVEAM